MQFISRFFTPGDRAQEEGTLGDRAKEEGALGDRAQEEGAGELEPAGKGNWDRPGWRQG